MIKDTPNVSMIIPTNNRSALLRKTIDALCVQTYPLQQLEVLVVADGCTDGTVEMLRYYRAPFALHVIEQSGKGAAAARNNGAANAKGSLLIFLDDDIESAPSLIEAYVNAHQHRSNQVFIGYSQPVFQGKIDFFRIGIRSWWEDRFCSMRQIGHRYTYRDLFSGNFSIRAELFSRLGGFNPALRCREDYDLGIRLIKAGVDFTFVDNALGYNHETSNLDRSFQRTYQEALADVLVGYHHSELRCILPLARLGAPRTFLSRNLCTLAFRLPAIGDIVATRIRLVLNLLERARLRRCWRQLCGVLRYYWYWRGVMEGLGTPRALDNFLQGGSFQSNKDDPEIEIDLREGLEAAELRMDKERPAGIRIRHGQQPVGRIPPQPGAERLRGSHLRPILATDLAWPLLKALAVDGSTGAVIDINDFLSPTPRNIQKTSLIPPNKPKNQVKFKNS